MIMNNSNKEFYPGQIIWFYYGSVIPCQKGEIINYVKDNNLSYYNVDWIDKSFVDGHEFKAGTSGVLPDRIFKTEKECWEYVEKLSNIKRNEIRERINSKEELLQFMINCICSEDYDYIDEKVVIREKIEEYFGIELE